MFFLLFISSNHPFRFPYKSWSPSPTSLSKVLGCPTGGSFALPKLPRALLAPQAAWHRNRLWLCGGGCPLYQSWMYFFIRDRQFCTSPPNILSVGILVEVPVLYIRVACTFNHQVPTGVELSNHATPGTQRPLWIGKVRQTWRRLVLLG